MTNASKLNDFLDFTRYAASIMSDQRDGFGYAAQGEAGVFGTRTLFPSDYGMGIKGNDFGLNSKVIGAAMFHGRVSTNDHTLLNTHPIERDNHYIIHNGVVTNHGPTYTRHTTNDSEDVLYHWLNGGIEKVSEYLTGYYAAGIFTPENNLIVFRDSIAQLHFAYSEVLESYIFTTTQMLMDRIGEYIGESLNCNALGDDVYLRFKGNELIEQVRFKSRGFDSYSASLSSKSLGYRLDETINSIDDLSNISISDNDELFQDLDDDFINEYQDIDGTYSFFNGDFYVSFWEWRDLPLEEQIMFDIYREDMSEVKVFKESKYYSS